MLYWKDDNEEKEAVNCPFKTRNYQRDGPQTYIEQSTGPNYFPNSFNGPIHNEKYIENPITIENNIQAKRYDSSNEDNYSQVGIFWRRVLKEDERERLIQNMSSHLVNAADFLQERAVNNFTKCDPEYGRRLKEALARLNLKRQVREKSNL